MTIHQIEEQLEELRSSHGFHDWRMEFRVAYECAWEGHLTITPPPTYHDPDRSLTLFVAGCDGPQECAQRLLAGLLKWAAEQNPSKLLAAQE